MSALDDIEAAATAEQALVAAMAAFVTTANTSIANALAAMNAPSRAVYVDAVGGSDANTGVDAGHAFATVEHALSSAKAGQYLFIQLLSDVTIATGWVGNGLRGVSLLSSGALRKITFSGAGYIDDGQNGAGLFFGSTCDLEIDANIEVHAFPTGHHIRSAILMGKGGRLIIGDLVGCSLTVSSPNVPLLSTLASVPLLATFVNFTLGSGAPGFLFAGVASGGDPNALYEYTSNVTSA